MNKYNLTIGWLYPELMSTYGDTGNVIVLQRRCEWRNISVEIKRLDAGFKIDELKNCDFLFMGGAQDKQQRIVAEDLMKKREKLKNMINAGIPGLYICGAYQFLGIYYKEAKGTIIKGLDILDLYTENPGENHPRLIGNAITKIVNVKYLAYNANIVGFENHGGRTYLGRRIKPFGKVIKGFGNNGQDQTEGAVYKNSFGTYFHGPILPKNPEFADLLIKLALENKYLPHRKADDSPIINLSPLNDFLENKAHLAIANRLNVKI